MSTTREPVSTTPVQSSQLRVSVGQFAERFRGEAIPLSNTFSYFCASLPMSEEVLKEYLEEPVAALPPAIAGMLPRISLLLVPYLERSSARAGGRKKAAPAKAIEKLGEYVVGERPADGNQSWASQVSYENETVLVFALKEQDVAEYHYRLYRHLSALLADKIAPEEYARYTARIREELVARVHGEVDDDSWQAKQLLLRRPGHIKKEAPLFHEYVRQSFIDTLTLFLHGICCDIDVETGPRQLPSRHLRLRLQLLKSMFPPPSGYSLFPEDSEATSSTAPLLLTS